MVRALGRTNQGFTYLAVLILLVIVTSALAAAGTRWTARDQRNREAMLLHDGAIIRAAIGAYYESTPGSVKRYPATLEDLLRDTRYLGMRRYLRKIPHDPMSQQIPFVLVVAPDGGAMGVHSSSDKAPFKVDSFSTENASFSQASRYSDWEFVYLSPVPP